MPIIFCFTTNLKYNTAAAVYQIACSLVSFFFYVLRNNDDVIMSSYETESSTKQSRTTATSMKHNKPLAFFLCSIPSFVP